jgi:hypothetical protein
MNLKHTHKKSNVQLENETFWLSLEQMVQLFEKTKSTINEHID